MSKHTWIYRPYSSNRIVIDRMVILPCKPVAKTVCTLHGVRKPLTSIDALHTEHIL